jgi:hypothetical protein
MKFDNKAFHKWEDETHIPEKIMTMVNAIAKQVGCDDVVEETIPLYNRGDQVIGFAKGFSLTHCTSSYADGPSQDYSKEMAMWLKGLGFVIENSYGDNGMDCSTNLQDTYWTHEFIYKPTEVYEERFIIYEDKDYIE